jgi:RNA polymerase sigma-70 factor (ECF subfamily)
MGESRPFIALYDDFAEPIYRYIYYKTCHRETAEDITSQTFLKAMEKWQQFNSNKGSLSTWLYAIARNQVTDHFRSKRKWGFIGSSSDIWDLPTEDRTLQNLIREEMSEELHKALNSLSAIQREVVILRVWEDMPYREISVLTGKSEASCKMLFSRTLKKLKTDLGAVFLYELLICPFTPGRSDK